jgi:hypothetical protein
MVEGGIGGVDHNANLATIVGESFVQNGMAIVFDHRRFDSGIQQQASSALPVGTILGLKWSLIDPDTFRAGKPCSSTVFTKQLGDALSNRTTTASSGDPDERDAT